MCRSLFELYPGQRVAQVWCQPIQMQDGAIAN
jgi:hypothetical protein